jgi:hypothetical protein
VGYRRGNIDRIQKHDCRVLFGHDDVIAGSWTIKPTREDPTVSIQKHICGYPIWVGNEKEEDHWITIFKDDPEGRKINRCPGCGGRLVPWEVRMAEESGGALRATFIELIQATEANLYSLAPERKADWEALTRPARELLDDQTLPPPPWEETGR